jgi:hypothetical protein
MPGWVGVADWSTVASLATAAGTLILAASTFLAVRSANRASRVAEYSMQIGLRPLLMQSRLDDAPQKIMWGDEHWARLSGGGAAVEIVDGNVYLAMSVRNAGAGIAVIQGWHLGFHELPASPPPPALEEFRPQQRDLYVPGGDAGFWQAAIRDPDDPSYADAVAAGRSPRTFTVELLYTDHEGGQRAIGRFAIAPVSEGRWLCSVNRHWNLDRPTRASGQSSGSTSCCPSKSETNRHGPSAGACHIASPAGKWQYAPGPITSPLTMSRPSSTTIVCAAVWRCTRASSPAG